MALVTVQRSPSPSATSSPSVSEADSGEEDRRSQSKSISENFLTVKGAALFLPRGNGSSPSSVPRITQRWNKHAGDLQQHLQGMFTLLRPEDNIRLAVRLESARPHCTRYMVVVTTNGRQDTEESVVLGIDFTSSDSFCSVGLVLPLWSDTLIHLDGDGGFSVSTVNRVHVFKPVSVQAMWSALQSLHKACEVARCHNYYPGSLFLTWVSYYQSRVASDQACINEWNAMQDVQSHRADSPVLFTDVPTERERTERLIKTRLREIMMQKDLENVTSKEIRTELELQMVCNLREFKEFIDNEMIVILGQMDSATEIFDHVYLGSEWNASNLEELQNSGVRYILNVTREIDNFFPGMFEYHNIRVYDEEATNLLEYWNDTYKFISKAKKAGAKCLVHCKMGVSRSASTVIAYAMKEYGWDLERAFDHVKERRTVTKPNPAFMRQLEEYQGILVASKQRHNKLWRSHSDSDLSERHEPLGGRMLHALGRSDPHNNNNAPPLLQDFLGMAVLQALAAEASEPSAMGDLMGLTDSKEAGPFCQGDSLLSPRPRPRAATMVPGKRADSSSPIAMRLAHPFPPSSPRSPCSHAAEPKLEGPELQTTAAGWSQPSISVPEQNSLPLSLPAPNVKLPQAVLSRPRAIGINRQPSTNCNSETENSQASPGTPMAVSPLSPSELCLESDTVSNDDNNNPSSAETSKVPNTSNLSVDSIDFFSAREKFLGLSQDGQAGMLAEQATPRITHTRSLSQGMPPVSLEEPSAAPCPEGDSKTCHSEAERESSYGLIQGKTRGHQENSVSVRDIVTELESMSNSVPPASQPGPRGPPQEVEKEEEPKAEDLEAAGSLSPSSNPQSPSPPPSDWQSVSVRRATEQLEQRIHQKSGQAATPRQASMLAQRNGPVTVEKPEEDRDQAQKKQRKEVSHEDGGDFGCENPEDSSHTNPFESSCSASRVAHVMPRSKPLATSVRLKGVTELETDVDTLPEGPSQGADSLQTRSHQDLENIQKTLWELQAFLREAGRLTGVGKAERVGTEEAVELEARIRQAGLTPPSLMKRSASLAKLDCLELSTNDLSEWDLGPPPVSPSSTQSSTVLALQPRPHPAPDDTFKKQRVLGHWPPRACSTPEDTHGTPGFGCCDPNSDHSQFSQNSDPGGRIRDTSSATPSASTLAQSTLHGKSHLPRRLRRPGDKKRASAFLYNTM